MAGEMDNSDNRCPETYMFTGFVAFAMMGPRIPEGFESNSLLQLFDRDVDDTVPVWLSHK
jgi:hypothetical protein